MEEGVKEWDEVQNKGMKKNEGIILENKGIEQSCEYRNDMKKR